MKRAFLLLLLFVSTLFIAKIAQALEKNNAIQAIQFSAYQTQADKLYQHMSLQEKIGELLLPSYRLLANAVPSPKGKPAGYRCIQLLQNKYPPLSGMLSECGFAQIGQYHLGAVLADGGPFYQTPSLQNWAWLNSTAQAAHQQAANQHDLFLLTGNDAIHGNSHLAGAVIFPHDINLGATHDLALVQTIGQLTADDSLHSGFNWVYMPTVAVAHDMRWGRSYESFSQDPQWVKKFAQAYVAGLQQNQSGKITGVLATVKHFIGDGATQYGLDEGDSIFAGSKTEFWQQNGLGYEGAINAGVGSLMVSYSAINGQRMHLGDTWGLLNQLKNSGVKGSDGEYSFKGFAVSDYNGPTRAAYFYNQQHPTQPLNDLSHILAKTINAGADMIMLGLGDQQDIFAAKSSSYFNSVGQVANALTSAYQQNLISESRLHDAVTRILMVKLAMTQQIKEPSYANLQEKERATALQAAEESVVLLKKNNAQFPLRATAIKNIIFVGASNDLGLQNGGWTINWQGQKGDQYFTGNASATSGASTIEQALIKHLDKNTQVYHTRDVATQINRLSSAQTVVVAVVAEPPYAEYMGDIANPNVEDRWYKKGIHGMENSYMSVKQRRDLQLTFNPQEAKVIKLLRARKIPVVTVVYSGRPMDLTQGDMRAPWQNSDDVIAAFLPGTLGGEALARVILGEYHLRSANNGLSNTLSFPWPQLGKDSGFPMGYGLAT